MNSNVGQIDELRTAARIVTTDEISFLRVFEELLYLYVRKEGLNPTIKQAAFEVLRGINKKQLEMMESIIRK